MSDTIASEQFGSTLEYSALPAETLVGLFRTARQAHGNFFQLWQRAVRDRFGEPTCAELTALVYPGLAAAAGDLEKVFYQELNFLWRLMPSISGLLTLARYDARLLPETLSPDLDLLSLSGESLALLWNVAALTYVMQTSRWTDLVTERYGQDKALKLERDVWLDYGGATDDLRYGLQAAGREAGDVETLFRGFQMAPGEVGLVDAVFSLDSPRHGRITHRRCPSHQRFGESNRARLESNCLLCVTAMRLSGEMVNPDIRCRPLSLPPHREQAGHACQWEYWVES
jgi:hypothetical protein